MVWLRLADTLRFDARRRQETVEILRRLMRSAPLIPEVFHVCGHVQWGLGERDKATELYRLAVCQEPTTQRFQGSYVVACRLIKRPDDSLRSLRHQLEQLHGVPPTIDEVARLTGFRRDKVERHFADTASNLSLDHGPVGEVLTNTLPDPRDDHDVAARGLDAQRLHTFLRLLPKRTRKIIEHYYGFGRKPQYIVNASVLEYEFFAADKYTTATAINMVIASNSVINAASSKNPRMFAIVIHRFGAPTAPPNFSNPRKTACVGGAILSTENEWTTCPQINPALGPLSAISGEPRSNSGA